MEAVRQRLGTLHLHPSPRVHLIGTVKGPHTRCKGEGALIKGKNKPLSLLVALRCPASLWAAAVCLGETCFQGGVELRCLE